METKQTVKAKAKAISPSKPATIETKSTTKNDTIDNKHSDIPVDEWVVLDAPLGNILKVII